MVFPPATRGDNKDTGARFAELREAGVPRVDLDQQRGLGSSPGVGTAQGRLATTPSP